MASVNEIRTSFLDFFKRNGHEIVPSGPLVPLNDPTLMFTNAGMVPFKNVFTGVEKRPYSRAASSQKCVRAGGKHNDLDNVGYTARHHTFFEMLGNFSFGDYFKETAIELAWELMTKEFALTKERLLVTVFAEDDEAYDLWKKIAGLPDSKIIRIATSDNFWSMGDTGPCGPCSEIFFDHGDKIPGGPPGSPDEDGDRFIEIWNLVFMQYENITPDERIDLPRPSIDTGMGLERTAAVLQGTHDNYETDMMQALIKASVDASNVPAEGKHNVSHRVIADHLRSTSFLIADGVLPSNEGRGYVLRRIMRRAMRHAELLGMKEPLMWQLVPALVHEMGQAYPELHRAQALITETLKLEEARFRKTLERGLKMLDEASADLKQGDALDGEFAFKLYDTYGFPLDLTQDALKSQGISVDVDTFNIAMERQRTEARAAWSGSGDAATEDIWFQIRETQGATEFLGYDTEQAEGEVRAILVDGKQVQEIKKGQEAYLVLNQTPFYGESGGQVGDTGVMTSPEGGRFKVRDTQKKLGDVFVHLGVVEDGTLKVGDALELTVDPDFRQGVRINHSATHLLHEALRETLGDHIAQKGSLVVPGRLRFDVSHPKSMSAEELRAVEDIANQVVLQDDEVTTRLMSVDEAIEAGAMALFGEKYGDEVRVVSMGRKKGPAQQNEVFSMELCGGTHVNRTGEIGLIKIVSESAVAAGVRRIEALSGPQARDYLVEQDQRLQEAARLLKTKPQDVASRLTALLDERKALDRALAEAKRALALGGGSGGESSENGSEQDIEGLKVIARAIEDIDPKDLRGLVDDSKKQLGTGIVAIIGVNEGKAGLVVGVTKDLTEHYDAVELVQAGATALGGKGGGGRRDMAQAGGPDGAKAQEALEAITSKIGEMARGI